MTLKHTILGDTWYFKVLKRMPKGAKDADGVTYPSEKVVVFKESGLTLSTIVHELTHAYYSYQLHETTTEVTPSDFEEIHAEFTSRYGTRVLKDAISILLKILDKKKLPIQSEDRTLIGDLFELSEVLDILGERLGFDRATSQ